MIYRSSFIIFIAYIGFSFFLSSCSVSFQPGKAPRTQQEAERLIIKEQALQQKKAVKERDKMIKDNLKLQSKAVRKRIKKSNKRQMKKIRKERRRKLF